MTSLRRLAPVLLWVAGLVALGILMVGLGHGTLGGPSLTRPSTWSDWAAARSEPDAAVAVLRLLVLGLDAYLLAATVLAVVVRLVRAERLITVADLLTVPAVLRVVQAGLGIGLVGASVAAAASAGVTSPAVPTRADVALVSSEDDPPMIRELPARTSGPTTTTTSTSVPAPAPAAVLVAPEPAPAPHVATWLVRPGDHFWFIAERSIADAWGREPTDAEIVPYWEQLIERNRDALADRDNADLIFPGQTFVLPAVPVAP